MHASSDPCFRVLPVCRSREGRNAIWHILAHADDDRLILRGVPHFCTDAWLVKQLPGSASTSETTDNSADKAYEPQPLPIKNSHRSVTLRCASAVDASNALQTLLTMQEACSLATRYADSIADTVRVVYDAKDSAVDAYTARLLKYIASVSCSEAQINDEVKAFMDSFDATLSEQRKTREAEQEPDDEGWVTVRKRSDKSRVPSLVAAGLLAADSKREALNSLGRSAKRRAKKKLDSQMPFYKFERYQQRLGRFEELLHADVKSKEARAERKFRPY